MSILLWITIEIKFFCCLPTVVKKSTLKELEWEGGVDETYFLTGIEEQWVVGSIVIRPCHQITNLFVYKGNRLD